MTYSPPSTRGWRFGGELGTGTTEPLAFVRRHSSKFQPELKQRKYINLDFNPKSLNIAKKLTLCQQAFEFIDFNSAKSYKIKLT